jgi:lipoate-protein ligase B
MNPASRILPVAHSTIPPSPHLCRTIDLGLMGYQAAYDLQKKMVQEVIDGKENTLFLCEHPAVFTIGRMGSEDHILASKDIFSAQGVSIVRIDRGGEVTFHGPGQLIAYPIFRLDDMGRDLKGCLGKLEKVAIDFLEHFGIVANSISGKRGVWVGQKKIASIGIGIRRWVTFHGIGININTDLSYFQMIRPCGMDVQMTSVSQIKGSVQNIAIVKNELLNSFKKIFQLEFVD